MKLTRESGDDIVEPTMEQIRQAISDIPPDEPRFIILSAGEQDYMQAQGSQDGGFVLEYRAGSIAEHYQAANTALSAADIERAFHQYLAHDSGYKNAHDWVPVEEAMAKNGCFGVLLAALVPAVGAAFALFR